MTRGLKEGEPNGRDVYPDIIDHPHWQSPTRPHMSLYDRAAQFSSFDALSGYSDMISEEQRLTDQKTELSESGLEALNHKLSLVNDALKKGQNPVVSITYFIPDQLKAGGSYRTITRPVKRIDVMRKKLILMDADNNSSFTEEISIYDILDIQ